MPSPVQIIVLNDRGDHRGSSFAVPAHWSTFLPSAKDIHLTSLRPGHVRGNHFHRDRKEAILVVHLDEWSLFWDSGPGSSVEHRTFSAKGVVLLTVEPLVAHAIKNIGAVDLYTMALTDGPYDPEHPDTYVRTLTS